MYHLIILCTGQWRHRTQLLMTIWTWQRLNLYLRTMRLNSFGFTDPQGHVWFISWVLGLNYFNLSNRRRLQYCLFRKQNSANSMWNDWFQILFRFWCYFLLLLYFAKVFFALDATYGSRSGSFDLWQLPFKVFRKNANFSVKGFYSNSNKKIFLFFNTPISATKSLTIWWMD